ncbi:MAG: hypothetical protein LKM38_21865 [Pseudomonas veronii]|nr:hypothetical protein [Pseudomonas veronii]
MAHWQASSATRCFSALFDYWGYEKAELAAAPAARRFLPVKVSPALITVTPLLKKLRDLNPPLTAANLARLLAEHPLTARQQEAFLSGWHPAGSVR